MELLAVEITVADALVEVEPVAFVEIVAAVVVDVTDVKPPLPITLVDEAEVVVFCETADVVSVDATLDVVFEALPVVVDDDALEGTVETTRELGGATPVGSEGLLILKS